MGIKKQIKKVIKSKKAGSDHYKEVKKIKTANKSPTPLPKLTKEDIVRKIEFCKLELSKHKKNQNKVMIGYKEAEIKDLEKMLK